MSQMFLVQFLLYLIGWRDGSQAPLSADSVCCGLLSQAYGRSSRPETRERAIGCTHECQDSWFWYVTPGLFRSVLAAFASVSVPTLNELRTFNFIDVNPIPWKGISWAVCTLACSIHLKPLFKNASISRDIQRACVKVNPLNLHCFLRKWDLTVFLWGPQTPLKT